ncbi:uncharacterized protein LOC132943807 isoform X2 [Metopolophium dirhodum]|uniref:uncharacterized protein LOC132943807 isoform X2 n=1 Tax=Metopolophium dirhodum TaxID=44670 RepID=UPI00298F67EB|nr:uncharacterized protein LOC132943807 isoform X2 [Metopolophium dirhodum]
MPQTTTPDNVHGIMQQGNIQIAPQIFVPDIPAGSSCVRDIEVNGSPVIPTLNDAATDCPVEPSVRNDKLSAVRDSVSPVRDNIMSTVRDNVMDEFYNNVDDDGDYAQVADIIENLGFCKKEDSYTTLDNGKRVSSANTKSAVRAKKLRLNLVKSPGFTQISTSSNNTITWYYVKNTGNIQNYIYFLDSIKSELINLLKSIASKNPIKFNLKLEATYNIPNVEYSSENRAFKTSAKAVFCDTGVQEIVEEAFAKLMKEQDEYTSKGSGFTLQCIDGLMLGVYKYTPIGGSSYIQLPDAIENKKATINPQNIDMQCFKWAILAKHVTGENKCRIGDNYIKHEKKYNFTNISFPTPLHQVKIFEKNNPNVSVNVYGIDKKFQPPKFPEYKVFPLKVVHEEKPDHFDLLIISDGDNSHYSYISNFSRLIRSQKTKHDGQTIFCKRCFTTFDKQQYKYKLNGVAGLEQHKLICGEHKPILPQIPEPGSILEFTAWDKTQRHPIVIYADFEAILKKTDEKIGEKTTAFQEHEPMSYGYMVKANDEIPVELLEKFGIPTSPVIYRGNENNKDVAKHFVDSIVDIAKKIEELLKTNIPIIFTGEQRKTHELCNNCNLCKTKFSRENHKVADHCHLSGKFRQSLCNTCNLKLQTPNFVPVFFHNLSNYDSHFIVTRLGYDTNSISVIPNSEEKFITFSKYISNSFTLRFIDTLRFMASSLSTLSKNLITPGFEKFRNSAKHFSAQDLPLVTRKGVYPYDYTDDWDKLEETSLPAEKDFYSSLEESHIKHEDFKHANTVWNHFSCQTLGEYSDLYLKIDVLLLADVFENFRDLCLTTYHLDPSFYYTAPGFSFDCMLKYTGQQLELLHDYDMLLMIEKGIRGGLTQASMRYAKANNEKTPDYDPTKPKSWLVYQDCNNLYGYAMSQFMPYGGFKWVEPTLDGLNALDDSSPIGRMYEVDISYPKELHDKHNDLPFLPKNDIPPGSKVKKLMATLHSKKNYVIHYRNLQQAIKNGLVVEKVHRVIQFNQSDWLKKYIELNTEMRKKAKNDFEKDFFKLLNNAVFGKTMENLRLRIKMELVCSEKRLQKLINLTTFKHCITYNETLNAISLENKIIKFCKPIYIGFAVLEISKTVMYDYHYNVMQAHYGNKIELMYTDTDSLVYYIQTDDFYKDLENNSNLLDRMDTSDLPRDHPCYIAERKKIPGLFSDETNSEVMTDFCALRSKSYAYKINGKEKIRAKGIRGHVVKNHMNFDDHYRCLFGDATLDTKTENVSIRSFKHQLKTIKSNKVTYNSFDDKRIILEDRIHTLAHGHYSTEEPDTLAEQDE